MLCHESPPVRLRCHARHALLPLTGYSKLAPGRARFRALRVAESATAFGCPDRLPPAASELEPCAVLGSTRRGAASPAGRLACLNAQDAHRLLADGSVHLAGMQGLPGQS